MDGVAALPPLRETIARHGLHARKRLGQHFLLDLNLPRRIVANLPYNVSTALLVRWLHAADTVSDMVLMFQKEVVDRLVARPRSKEYGRLSVLAQHVCDVRRLFDVAPSAFVPPPKVTS